LFISLYTMYTLKMKHHSFEKVLKQGSTLLLIACLVMPFSIVYTEGLVWVIELFNVFIQVYFSYKIMKAFKTFYHDVRVIAAVCYVMICIATIMQFIGLEATGNTIFLAFF